MVHYCDTRRHHQQGVVAPTILELPHGAPQGVSGVGPHHGNDRCAIEAEAPMVVATILSSPFANVVDLAFSTVGGVEELPVGLGPFVQRPPMGLPDMKIPTLLCCREFVVIALVLLLCTGVCRSV